MGRVFTALATAAALLVPPGALSVAEAAKNTYSLHIDARELNNVENSPLGSSNLDTQHITVYGSAHSAVQTTSADPAVIKLMPPMAYIGVPGVITSECWRIRHGSAGRDTSVEVSTLLAAKFQVLIKE